MCYNQTQLTLHIRGQRQNYDPTFRALNYGPHAFINIPNIGSLTVAVMREYLVGVSVWEIAKIISSWQNKIWRMDRCSH